MKQLLAWLNARAPRERTALIAGGGAALLLMLYGWLWLPLAADTARLRGGIAPLRAQAAQLASDSAEARRLSAAPRPQAAGEPLANGVEQSVQAAGMKDRLQVQTLDGNRVQISADGIAFNEWIALLAGLQQIRNARVESARIEPQAGSNLVRVQAVLSRPAANNRS